MTDYFNSGFFTSNRSSLITSLGSNLVVLSANGLLQRSADTTFAFRQDSNFWYLTGIEEPDYVLVINGDSTFLIEPKRSEHRDLWDGAIDKKVLKALSGITEIEEYHEGWTRLDILIKKYKKVHTIAPAEAYIESFGFYANPARGRLLEQLKKHRKIELVDIRKNLARNRQIKQTPELKAIQAAIDITSDSLKLVHKKLSTYSFEHEIAADLTREFIRRGANGHAYQPIVACGQNAATIHYVDNNQAIKPNELLLFDVGAEVNNYSADITRTYAVSKPTKRQKEVYKSVQLVHAAALQYLKPGINMREYEKAIDGLMAKELKKLKLIDDIDDKKKLKKYYPHLASHFLGLDVHDAADYDQPLAVGMVLTVEPGIYIPQESIGIRIEDDVLVTETGVKVLTDALPNHLS
jgi:Xaa-Pro aminopeptidase